MHAGTDPACKVWYVQNMHAQEQAGRAWRALCVVHSARQRRERTLRQEPVLDGERRAQWPLVVQDVHGDEQVVVVHLPLVLPRHYHRRLCTWLLRMARAGVGCGCAIE